MKTTFGLNLNLYQVLKQYGCAQTWKQRDDDN